MTKLSVGRKLKRETLSLDRRRPIIVELFPYHCCVRVKGTREFYAVDWEVLLAVARKMDAREKLAQKEQRRAS